MKFASTYILYNVLISSWYEISNTLSHVEILQLVHETIYLWWSDSGPTVNDVISSTNFCYDRL